MIFLLLAILIMVALCEIRIEARRLERREAADRAAALAFLRELVP